MIGCLDHPTMAASRLDADVATPIGARAEFRGKNIGFIFQDFNLIPVFTAFENVEYPLIMVQNWPPEKRREQVRAMLAAVGMTDQADKRPDQLSGGQKQRVAVARALVAHSKLVLADEPTANLDHDTAYRIIELMRKMRDDLGTTFVFSTHDPKIMREAEVTFTRGWPEPRRQHMAADSLAARNSCATAGARCSLALIVMGVAAVLLFVAISGLFSR
jgi:putative ABC transport system ATP-binding protein